MRPGGGPGEPQRAGGFVAARAVILLAAAVVIGAATLNAFDRGANPYGTAINADAGSETPTTKKPRTPGAAAVTTTTSTTLPPRPHPEVKVMAVNGTNTAGVAGRTGDFLRREGFNVLSPQTGKTVTSTTVQYAPGRDSDAREVARVLGLSDAAVVPLSTPPPVPDTRGADVLVIVGPDLAERMTPATTPTTARRATTTTGVRPIPTTTTAPRATTTTSTPQ